MNNAMQGNGEWLERLKVAAVGRNPRRTLIRVAVLALASFIIFRFVLTPIRVEGESMWPTYRNHRVNFLNRLAYVWHEPRRGDVVGIRMGGDHVMLLKRIVGLPGETVEFRDGHLYINDRRLNEPYVRTPCRWNKSPAELHADEYYVVGDNRGMPSRDHVHGAAERWRILGKTLL